MNPRRFRRFLYKSYREATKPNGYSLLPFWAKKEKHIESHLRTKAILLAVRNEIIRLRRLEIEQQKLEGKLDPHTKNIAKQSGDLNDTLPQNENDYKLSQRRLKMMDGMMLLYLKGKCDIHTAAAGLAWSIGCSGPVPLYCYDGLLTAAEMTGRISSNTRLEAQMELRGVQSQTALLQEAQKDPFGTYDATKVRLSGKNKWEDLGRMNGDTAEKKGEVKGQVLRRLYDTRIEMANGGAVDALQEPIKTNSHDVKVDMPEARKTHSGMLRILRGTGRDTANPDAISAAKKIELSEDALNAAGGKIGKVA